MSDELKSRMNRNGLIMLAMVVVSYILGVLAK